jgi:predicted ATPase
VRSNLVIIYMVRGAFQTARELAEQLLRLAQSLQDRDLLSRAHLKLGMTLHLLGEMTSARTHLEQGIALYDPQQHPGPTVGAYDPRLDCLIYASLTLWTLGYPEQALRRNHEAVALAEELSKPFSLAYALGHAARFHLYRREEQIARERAEAVMALSTEQGFPFWLMTGRLVWGWALAERGQEEEGIAQMQQGLAARRAMGTTEVGWAVFIPRLATAYARVGRVEEGLSVVAEALDFVDKTGMRVREAELYQVKGELLLTQEDSRLQAVGCREKTEEAEACFLKAIEISRCQSAKSLELQAVLSLSRLWQSQGKKEEAHRMLAEIYSWFTEGFDTKDLQEAKSLLQELAS